jgi:hypothetical protein
MSQFPGSKPKSKRPPVDHAYVDADYSPWMKFNEKDFASVASNTATAAPVLAVASAVEALSLNFDPAMSFGAVGLGSLTTTFIVTWVFQTIFFAILKTIACLLRSQGESWFRNITAWFWKWVFQSAWETFTDTFFSWLPFRRRIIRPRIIPGPADDTDPAIPIPRKRIIDRIIPRRRVK